MCVLLCTNAQKRHTSYQNRLTSTRYRFRMNSLVSTSSNSLYRTVYIALVSSFAQKELKMRVMVPVNYGIPQNERTILINCWQFKLYIILMIQTRFTIIIHTDFISMCQPTQMRNELHVVQYKITAWLWIIMLAGCTWAFILK